MSLKEELAKPKVELSEGWKITVELEPGGARVGASCMDGKIVFTHDIDAVDLHKSHLAWEALLRCVYARGLQEGRERPRGLFW